MSTQALVDAPQEERKEKTLGWHVGSWKSCSSQSHFNQQRAVIILSSLSAFACSLRSRVSLLSRALFSRMSLMAL